MGTGLVRGVGLGGFGVVVGGVVEGGFVVGDVGLTGILPLTWPCGTCPTAVVATEMRHSAKATNRVNFMGLNLRNENDKRLASLFAGGRVENS